MTDSIEIVEGRVGYVFSNKGLLRRALIHCSYLNEATDGVTESNERLEFLGDAVLDLLVSEFLFCTYPEKEEGQLSQLRAQLVDASACKRYIDKWDISDFCLMAKGQQMHLPSSVLSDLFEAVLGAIYLDGGIEAAKRVFLETFSSVMEVLMQEGLKNYKRILQEHVAQKYQSLPIYKVERESGPDHEKMFTVSVFVQKEKWGEGEGLSKKEAEQRAAEQALERL